MITAGQDSSLKLEDPYFFLALSPRSCPSTLSSSTPILLHFLVFHALSHLHIFTYTLLSPWDHTSQLAPGEILCKLQDPFTYHFLLEDLSDTPRSFHYLPPVIYVFSFITFNKHMVIIWSGGRLWLILVCILNSWHWVCTQ